MTPAAASRHGRPRLPYQQLAILVICRLAEPVALTSVFPYLPEMIKSFGVHKNDVPKWAGVTSAMFSVFQCITGIPWGALSDKWGRKPVILISLSCTFTTTLLWGLSTSLPMAILVRAFGGASNGNVGTMRTAVAEMVPWKELQPQAYSIMPLVWTIGSIFGPAIGGGLVFPAERYPSLFGNVTLFKRYPFLMPNLVAACLFAIGIITGTLFLRETLETKRNRRDYGRIVGKKISSIFTGRFREQSPSSEDIAQESDPLLGDPPTSNGTIANGEAHPHRQGHPKPNEQTSKTGWKTIFTTQTSLNILVYAMLAMHTISFDQLVSVFMNYPLQDPEDPEQPPINLPFKFAGGFDLDSKRIGFLLTMNAFFGIFAQFLLFPPMAHRYGVLNCLKVVSFIFPVIYFVTPFTALLSPGMPQQAVMFLILISKTTAGAFAFPCSTILLTNSAVSLRVLGTLNGVATTASALGRATGPALCGLVFTAGLNAGYIGAAWWLMSGLAILAAIPAFWVLETNELAHQDRAHVRSASFGSIGSIGSFGIASTVIEETVEPMETDSVDSERD